MESEVITKKLYNEFSENINSHVFLLETDNQIIALNDVKELIQRIIKADDSTKKQINDENYLELIIIRPDGNEIKKDQILDLQERIKVMPILSNYMFYIITQAELLNESSSNKLLKTLEEPNDKIIGFLISSNNDLILPTIKSRCEIEKIRYNQEKNIETETLLNDISIKIINLIENSDLLEFHLFKENPQNKSYIQENGKNIAIRIKDYYNTACNLQNNLDLDSKTLEKIKNNNEYKTIIEKCWILNNLDNKLTMNMNKELLLEKIFIELKEVKANAGRRN